jgi:hypothetical protein
MLKRIILIAFFISALALLAQAPLNVKSAPENAVKLQDTVVVTVSVGVTSAPPGNSAGAGMPMSTLVIIGLLVILGLAVIIGGMGLLSRRGPS